MAETTGADPVPKPANAAAPGKMAAAAATTGTTAKATVAEEMNPAFKMMGLPNFKAKLPSRNWMIFLGITGSFAAAVAYDKYQTKRTRQKWCDLVAPLAEQTIGPDVLARRVTVYIEAQPADGLRNAREHFHEYIKPTLVAAAMDWDVVEGRREGDVRYGTAERIRRYRQRKGEQANPRDDDTDPSVVVENLREGLGTPRESGPAGDLVVGRHAWKEYVRGVHEGWLGPMNKPEAEIPSATSLSAVEQPLLETIETAAPVAADAATTLAASAPSSPPDNVSPPDDASPTAPVDQPAPVPEAPKTEEAEKTKRLLKPDPYISTSAYASAQPPPSMPQELGPTAIIPVAHILGFWKFPIRIWRFLNRRELADDIGRRTAALCLASSRPFDSVVEPETALDEEEAGWHKSVRKRDRSDGAESVWLDPIVFDERIIERMRLFELTRDDEERAAQLFQLPRGDKKDSYE
ncbi:hypothetical protein AAFC00_005572 [Neodothiora populina]|uniref:Mitochondrial import inner membrane translocase subunit TIM54 n=1 Tax=Neodothiora populina TaxID=2781224 RepID=A0ABR3PLA1_9PEZI